MGFHHTITPKITDTAPASYDFARNLALRFFLTFLWHVNGIVSVSRL